MYNRHTHLQNSKPKKQAKTTKLTGKNTRLEHITSHHRKAVENNAIKNINDNYLGKVI